MTQVQQLAGKGPIAFVDPELGAVTIDVKKKSSGLAEHYETMKDYAHLSVDIDGGEFKAFNAKLWEILSPAEQAKAKALAEKVRGAVQANATLGSVH